MYDIKIRIKVIDRAEQQKLLINDRITLVMDLDIAVEYYKMDLERLIAFDDYNFAHDIIGIQARIDRSKKEIINDHFVPRCARSDTKAMCDAINKLFDEVHKDV